MKRLAVVALMVIGLALPVCAQRSGSRGGFSGHSSGAFHGSFGGGFRGAAPSRFGGFSHYSGSGVSGMARGTQRSSAANFSSRGAYAGRRRYRRPYVSIYGTGYPYYGAAYPYAYSGLIGSDYLGYPDDIDDSTASTSDQGGANEVQPSEAYQPPDYGPYQPPSYQPPPYPSAPYPRTPYQPSSGQAHPQPPPENQNEVTLVFKDGRPPEKIHNYLLTRTTLYVGGQHQRDIPIDQLDVDATVKVNREAGVDFSLPTNPGS